MLNNFELLKKICKVLLRVNWIYSSYGTLKLSLY